MNKESRGRGEIKHNETPEDDVITRWLQSHNKRNVASHDISRQVKEQNIVYGINLRQISHRSNTWKKAHQSIYFFYNEHPGRHTRAINKGMQTLMRDEDTLK